MNIIINKSYFIQHKQPFACRSAFWVERLISYDRYSDDRKADSVESKHKWGVAKFNQILGHYNGHHI